MPRPLRRPCGQTGQPLQFLTKVISFARITRRRKVLVTAFLPYLLLSVFVNFGHLHRLISGPIPSSSSLTSHVNPSVPGGTKLPDASCAICQWQRAGTGMQASVTDEPTPDLIATVVEAYESQVPSRLHLGSPDFRGPPAALSV
jgi:hypothetical protein